MSALRPIDPEPLRLSVLFVNHESWEHLAEALVSLRRHRPESVAGRPLELEVVVVDNASSSGGAGRRCAERALAALGGVLELAPENRGYGAGMNRAAARARGELLLFCNPDLVFQAGCVERLAELLLACADVGVAAPSVFLDRELCVRAPAHVLPTPRDLVGGALAMVSPWWNRRYSRKRTARAAWEWQREGDLDEAMFGGCCFLMRRALFEELGGFDEGFPLYFEDTDLARRVRRARRRIVQLRSARVVHLYGRSSARAPERAAAAYEHSRRRYFRKWHGWPGALLYRLVRAGLSSAAARSAHGRLWATGAAPLAADARALELPRTCSRVLVELCGDPLFLLAGGSLGSGARWELPADVRARGEPLWLRALDLDGPAPRELGRWRLEPRPQPAAFNRVLEDFEGELACPEAALVRAELGELVEDLARRGAVLRLDSQREWELARVLNELEQLRAERGVERVLDAGAGNGALAYLLARRGFRVVALDVDPVAVESTRRQARELGLVELEAVLAARRWPLADESFDAVACVSVLEGVLRKDRPAFWGEMRRVLCPGGALLLTCDFGPDARFVGDAPLDLVELERDVIAGSGLALHGPAPRAPRFGPAGAPVRARAATPDGGSRDIAYTFAALRLEKALTGTGRTPAASPGAGLPAGAPGPR